MRTDHQPVQLPSLVYKLKHERALDSSGFACNTPYYTYTGKSSAEYDQEIQTLTQLNDFFSGWFDSFVPFVGRNLRE